MDFKNSLPELVTAACDIANDAAMAILAIYNTDFSIEKKDDRTPLTEADMASHKIIVSQLAKLTPDIPVLSEESTHISYQERKNWNHYWLIDPLDGTREFIKRNGEFTINIALIEQNSPVLGIVHVPVSGITYSANHKNGAYKKDAGKESRINSRKTDTTNIIVAGSRSHSNERQQIFINNLGDIDVISIGSSLKFCLVAEGKADIYPRFGPTSEWDTAAAQCIVEEAGGAVTDIDLVPLRYNQTDSCINPEFLVIGDRSFDWRPFIPE